MLHAFEDSPERGGNISGNMQLSQSRVSIVLLLAAASDATFGDQGAC
jgi:hypothetical protein